MSGSLPRFHMKPGAKGSTGSKSLAEILKVKHVPRFSTKIDFFNLKISFIQAPPHNCTLGNYFVNDI